MLIHIVISSRMASKNEVFRPLVLRLVRGGKNAREIHEKLSSDYGSEAPGYSTISRWVRFVNNFESDLSRGHSSGRPPTEATDENVASIRSKIENNRKFSVRILASETGLARETVRRILTEKLGLKKLAARWVPRA